MIKKLYEAIEYKKIKCAEMQIGMWKTLQVEFTKARH
jgi:hypothetical protein